jgi:hypothetical protein
MTERCPKESERDCLCLAVAACHEPDNVGGSDYDPDHAVGY